MVGQIALCIIIKNAAPSQRQAQFFLKKIPLATLYWRIRFFTLVLKRLVYLP
jgi:hypothetical protein